MNIYLVTIHPQQIFFPETVHQTVVSDQSVNAWWHYLPNVWLLRSNMNAQYHANRIIGAYPGLNFLVTKIDLDDYNGYLPQAAWDWIRAHYEKPVTYKELPKSPLLEALIKPKTTSPTQSAIEQLLKKYNK